MMTFEQRLDLALLYAKRQNITITPERRSKIEAKIREKMEKSASRRAQIAEAVQDTEEGGVEPYTTYGTFQLSRIEDRFPITGGDLHLSILNSAGACIIRMFDGSKSHTFTLPAYGTTIGG